MVFILNVFVLTVNGKVPGWSGIFLECKSETESPRSSKTFQIEIRRLQSGIAPFKSGKAIYYIVKGKKRKKIGGNETLEGNVCVLLLLYSYCQAQ